MIQDVFHETKINFYFFLMILTRNGKYYTKTKQNRHLKLLFPAIVSSKMNNYKNARTRIV